MGKHAINKRELLKSRCLEYIGGKVCGGCGVGYLPSICYDFHHRRGAKESNISLMVSQNVPWSKLKKELDKCEVLCKNCHAQKHLSH